MAKDTNAVAVVNTNANLPAFLQEFAPAAPRIANAEDLLTPRLKLVQATSEDADAHPEAVGKYLNTVTGDSYDEFEFFNLGYQPKYIASDRTPTNPSGKQFLTFDTRAEAQAKADEIRGVVIDSHRRLIVMVNEPHSVYALDCASTALGASKLMNTIDVTKFQNMPRQAPVWKASVERKSNDKGRWYGVKFDTTGGFVQSRDQLVALQEMSKGFGIE